jgi:small subunit ribosomal protein S16
VGGRKDPVWRVVVADQRSPRDGRVIETIGHYNAQTHPSTVVIDEGRAQEWIARGAQPSKAVRKLLKIRAADSAQAKRVEDSAHAERTAPEPVERSSQPEAQAPHGEMGAAQGEREEAEAERAAAEPVDAEAAGGEGEGAAA